MAYSEAQKRATMKYMAEKREKITLNFPRGVRDRIQDHVALTDDKSLTAFLMRAIDETIKRDRETGKVHPFGED